MWPFTKKYPRKEDISITEEWSVFQGASGDKPMLASFNTGVKSIAGHPDYQHQVGIAVRGILQW